ncbi:MAG: hypothetical protein HKO59_15180 [Phycisphaerales bacterium]|nr:hypothetical protein [Phycisphaerales bacterium]NNM27303.1 hypothetical protein [Phycisphaerales bacterium]
MPITRFVTTAPLPPTCLFACVHKGASSFVTQVIAPIAVTLYPGLEHREIGALFNAGRTEALVLPPRGVVATRIYPKHYDRLADAPPAPATRLGDKRIVLVRRDPRDVAVSMYYSTAFSHPVPAIDTANFLRRRRALIAWGPQEGIRRDTAAASIEEFRAALRFRDAHADVLDAPYEQLVADPVAWLRRVTRHVGWPERLAEAVAPVIRRAVAPPARPDERSHKRRVTPGAWREEFDEELVERFDREIGADLASAGYEAGATV